MMRDWSVSVIIPAYKHEDYILHALAGVVRQDIFDSVKVYVSDDCSPDKTFEKAREFSLPYPNISVVRNPTNLGPVPNYNEMIHRFDSEFVAVLEADDFWVTPDKLRRQIEFLQDNEKVNGCFSEIRSVFTGKGFFHRLPISSRNRYGLVHLLDVLNQNPPLTFSNCCYRTDAFRDAFFRLKDRYFSDWLTNMFIAEQGGLGYIPGASMVYRIHPGGIWSGASPVKRQQMLVEAVEAIMTVLPGRYTSFFQEKLHCLRNDIA